MSKEISCENCQASTIQGELYGLKKSTLYCVRYCWSIKDAKVSARICDHYEPEKEIKFRVGKPEKLEFEL